MFCFVLLGVIGIVALVASSRKQSSVPRQPRPEWQLARSPVLYENEEKIQLIRDADGHISELIIHRRVTQDV